MMSWLSRAHWCTRCAGSPNSWLLHTSWNLDVSDMAGVRGDERKRERECVCVCVCARTRVAPIAHNHDHRAVWEDALHIRAQKDRLRLLEAPRESLRNHLP